jgi:choice-of-anchor B domain-containing protein
MIIQFTGTYLLKEAHSMKRLLFSFLALNFIVIFGLQCVVHGQESSNVTLLARMNDHATAGYNECWGYIAPDGREYALLGVNNGMSVIDITDTNNPVEVAFFASQVSRWKDIKTYRHYAYAVNETGGGLQIFDLSGLPNSATELSPYTGFEKMHNLYIDEENAMLYANPGKASEPCQAISLANPEIPVLRSTFGVHNHDAFARDGIVYLSEGRNGSFSIFDLRTPSNPVLLSRFFIPNGGYVHNAWLTDDSNFLMTTEETSGKTVKLWDIRNLENIELTDTYLGPNGLAHNTHIKGDYAYLSHYDGGLRIVNISDPGNILEEGYFTTQNAWGAWPFFTTGKVIISDISEGLYVVYFEGAREGSQNDPKPPTNVSAYSDFNTPSSIELMWTDPTTLLGGQTLSPAEFNIEIEQNGVQIASVSGRTQRYNVTGLTDGDNYKFTLFTRLIATDSTSFPTSVSWIAGGSPVPARPTNLTCNASNKKDAVLRWDDPTVQKDGTPLDDLSAIRIYRNGEPIASVAKGVETYTDTPPPGFLYTYQVTAIDNESPANESSLSQGAECFVGPTPDYLVWVGSKVSGRSADSGDSLFAALVANGESAFLSNDLFELGQDLSIFKAIFVVLGIASNNHIIKYNDPEGTALEAYLQNGGSLYVEGGDCFNFDPEVELGYQIRPWFGLADGNDGGADVRGVLGINDLSPFSFSYNGENSLMDELNPVASVAIWKNDENADICGVFNTNFGNGKAIGVVPSFGGFVNSSAALRTAIRKATQQNVADSVIIEPDRKTIARESVKRPFVKKAAHYPHLKIKRKKDSELYNITAGGVKIQANTKTDIIAAYLGLFGLSGNVAPQVVKSIADQVLPFSFAAYVAANLDTVFFDANGDRLKYAVATDGNTTARLNGSLLELSSASGNATQSRVTVTASDSEFTASDTFLVVFSVTQSPKVANPVPDYVKSINFDTFIAADLKDVFSDPDGDKLNYAVRTDGKTLANVNGSLLEIRSVPNSRGISQIIVTAKDLVYAVSDTFLVSMLLTTDIEEPNGRQLPQVYELLQNYPNPFNPSTNIRYSLPEAAQVRIEVFNTLGQRMAILANGQMPAGYHEIVFDARGFASGVYLYKLQVGTFVQMKKMILME